MGSIDVLNVVANAGLGLAPTLLNLFLRPWAHKNVNWQN